MITDGSFDRNHAERPDSLPTLATLAAIVIHNLDHTGRARRPKYHNNITAHRPEQATSDTTSPDTPHPNDRRPTRVPA